MMRRSVVLIVCVTMVFGSMVGVPFSASAEDESAESSTPASSTESSATSTDSVAPSTTLGVGTPADEAQRGTIVQVAPFPEPPPTTTTAPPNPNAAPANSGTGRRVVYSKGRMRVWLIEADGTVVHTYRVSGRLDQPRYGTYYVFSRSSYTCSIKSSNTCMRWMVRFTKGPSGDNIGFHEIPRKNGVPLQSESQLGLPLSAGCVRQGTNDAWFMWNWAGIGTKVVVVP